MGGRDGSMTLEIQTVDSDAAPVVSIVILTYNRPQALRILLEHLQMSLTGSSVETVVVDNGSDEITLTMVAQEFPSVRYIRPEENLGIEGRNVGLRACRGRYVITLDDDVVGIGDEDIALIIGMFEEQPSLGGICFKVVDAESGGVINWVHHYAIERFENEVFVTDEITEGAVAFRRAALDKSGLYPGYFFISHEGPDLAIRIMNCGYDVVYQPRIVVKHAPATEGRTPWRNYYFDTRNLFWLVVRNYPLWSGLKVLARGLAAMFVYSVRDGYLRYWAKGVADGIGGLRRVFAERVVMVPRTRKIIDDINRNRPSLLYMVRKRLFGRHNPHLTEG